MPTDGAALRVMTGTGASHDTAGQQATYRWICGTSAVRERCGMVHDAAVAGRLEHFVLDPDRLAPAADYVVDTIRANYPSLAIPYHSRWRHFAAGGHDRWRDFAASVDASPAERLRLAFELVIVSVLLDAGAGAGWSYLEPRTGQRFARSEGLGIASFDLFTSGRLCRDGRPGVDADGLERLTVADLATAFQAGSANPLAGIEGRVELLRSLARLMRARTDVFAGPNPRLGDIVAAFREETHDNRIAGAAILQTLTLLLNPIWPGRLWLGDLPLGDVWRHAACITEAGDITSGLVPFHKLSQWLAYSLVEPLEDSGIAVTDLDGLTGLPEYRNGGLFIDLGVLRLRDPAATSRLHRPSDEAIVEWRALTVVLLDRIAGLVRERLGLDANAMPLAKILEGGTWSAGRRIARELRSDGGPPLRIASDGTVF